MGEADSNAEKFLLCSNCFQDRGLKLDAIRFGTKNDDECPNCHSRDGRKLTRNLIESLAYRFFVLGTMIRFDYGMTPMLQINKSHETTVKSALFCQRDVQLMEDVVGINVFHYGPRLWMLGEITPLKDLQNAEKCSSIILRIINEYPKIILDTDYIFYRIRKSPPLNNPVDRAEYDSPPVHCLGSGRLDSPDFPILYASSDIEVCVHECRITAEDELYVATLSPTKPLKMLDLTRLLYEKVTEFESLDLAVLMLFLAGPHSYEITRNIVRSAAYAGFDGINYPSYFSLLRTGQTPFQTTYGLSNRMLANHFDRKDLAKNENDKIISNLALFGRPLAEGKIDVQCINRLFMKRVIYDAYFGPVGY